MSATYFAFLGYIAWTMLLLLALAVYRTSLVTSKQHKSLSFASDGSDVPGFGHRLTRTQANCVESFAFIGGILLFAIATGNTVITDPLAVLVLVARIAQSVVHLISVNHVAIQLRFAFFLVQFGVCGYWLVLLLYKFFM